MKLEEVYHILDSIQPNENGCMIWPGCPVKSYRTIQMDKYFYRAHVLCLERKLNRNIKPEHIACHTCDTPACVNPKHLYEGTRKSNMKDAINRGQWNGPYFTWKNALEYWEFKERRQ
jgi:hypothetical protein